MSTAQIDELINNNVSGSNNTDDEENEVGDWLEELLKIYWAVTEKRLNFKSSYVTSDEVARFPLKLRTATFHNQTKNRTEWSGNSTHSILSENVNIEISYALRKEITDRIQHLISSQSRIHVALPDGQFDHRALAKKREIDFHNEVIPDLEAWALSRGVHINFGVPHCFYGNLNYIRDGKSCSREQFPHLLEISSSPIDNDTEICTMLLLEDLIKNGYTRKPIGSDLNVEEVKESLRQIAVMHACSWAWQTATKTPIKKKWPIFLNTKQSTMLYGDLIKRGLPVMQTILRRYLENTDNLDDLYLVDRLKIIEPKIYTFLHTNLIPSTFPAPNSIIHQDLNYRNVFFKQNQDENNMVNLVIPDENNNLENLRLDKNLLDIDNEKNDANCSGPLGRMSNECRIVNWSLASIGPPLNDVAFLIFTSLSPAVRRQNTNDILKSYYKSFKEICEKLKVELTFSFPLILSQYSKSFLLAVLFVIGNLWDADTDATVDYKSMHIFTEALKDLVSMQII